MDFDEQNRPKKNRTRNGLRSYTEYVYGEKETARAKTKKKEKKIMILASHIDAIELLQVLIPT